MKIAFCLPARLVSPAVSYIRAQQCCRSQSQIVASITRAGDHSSRRQSGRGCSFSQCTHKSAVLAFGLGKHIPRIVLDSADATRTGVVVLVLPEQTGVSDLSMKHHTCNLGLDVEVGI